MGREMIYTHLKLDVHERILSMRSVENTIHKPHFQRLWEASSIAEREIVRQYILAGNKTALSNWMTFHTDLELGELSFNKLKKIGQKLHVRNYCRLERHELEDAIKAARRDVETGDAAASS